MKSSIPLLALMLSIAASACDDASRPRAAATPPTTQRTAPAPAQPPAAIRVAQANTDAPAALDPAGVLDDEERRLLQADDAALTRAERVARAHAQRKLVLADPEHPLRPVLLDLETRVASGEYSTMAQHMWSGLAAVPHRDDGDDPAP